MAALCHCEMLYVPLMSAPVPQSSGFRHSAHDARRSKERSVLPLSRSPDYLTYHLYNRSITLLPLVGFPSRRHPARSARPPLAKLSCLFGRSANLQDSDRVASIQHLRGPLEFPDSSEARHLFTEKDKESTHTPLITTTTTEPLSSSQLRLLPASTLTATASVAHRKLLQHTFISGYTSYTAVSPHSSTHRHLTINDADLCQDTDGKDNHS